MNDALANFNSLVGKGVNDKKKTQNGIITLKIEKIPIGFATVDSKSNKLEMVIEKVKSSSNELKTFSLKPKEIPPDGLKKPDTKSFIQKVKSLPSPLELSVKAAVKLGAWIDEYKNESLMADIKDMATVGKFDDKATKLAEHILDASPEKLISGAPQEQMAAIHGLGAVMSAGFYVSKEQKDKAFGILDDAAENIFKSGNTEVIETLISNINKNKYNGTEAFITKNMSEILKTSGGAKIMALDRIKGSDYATLEQRNEAQNSIIKVAQGIFDTGTPIAKEALYNSLMQSQEIDNYTSTTTEVRNSIQGLLEKNSKIILENAPSARANFGEKLHNSKILTEAGNLGIEKIYRFGNIVNTMKILGSVVEERLRGAQKDDNRPLLVIISAREDSEGSFSQKGGMVGQKIAFFQKAGYRVMYYEVDDKEGIAKSLADACGKDGKIKQADIVMFAAHGNRYAMSLGSFNPNNVAKGVMNGSEEVNVNDEQYLKDQNIGSYLKNKGHVVLWSCSTGQGEEKGRNMVKMWRNVFPQAKVRGIFGPTQDNTEINFDIGKNNKGEPVFNGVKFDVKTYQGNNIFQQFNKDLNKSNILPTWTAKGNPLMAANSTNSNYRDSQISSAALEQNRIFSLNNT